MEKKNIFKVSVSVMLKTFHSCTVSLRAEILFYDFEI